MDQQQHFSDLAYAAAEGQHHHLQLSLRNENYTQAQLDHCAHQAAYHGHSRCLQSLLTAGATLTSLGSDHQSLLLEAIHSGNIETVHTVVSAGFDLHHTFDAANSDLPPLHFAIGVKNNADIAEVLLKAGCDTEFKDRFDDTALIVAAQYGLLSIARLLINYKCVINHHGFEGNTALHRAAQQGFDDLCQYLLESGADINATNVDLDTALHLACEEGHTAVATVLLSFSTTTEHLNREMKNSFHCAARNGNVDLVDILLKAKVKYNCTDLYGNTPLLISSCFQHERFAIELLEKAHVDGVDINMKGEGGRSALHWGAYHGCEALAQVLLNRDVEIDSVDNTGDSPLTIAVQNKQFNIASLLLDYKPDVNIQGEFERGALHWLSLLGDNEDIFSRLLQNPALSLDALDYEGDSPLILSAMHQHYINMNLLLARGADVNIRGHGGMTALHMVSQKGCSGMAQALTSRGIDLDVQGDSGDTALLMAIKNSNPTTAHILIDSGANITCLDSEQRSILHYSCASNLPSVVFTVLTRCPEMASCQDIHGDTPLILATENCNFDLVENLLLHSVPNMTGCQKRTPLCYCAIHGKTQHVEMLLKYGAIPDLEGSAASPLIEASKRGHTDIVEMLLRQGSDANQRNHLGRTAAMWSAQGGHLGTLKVLHEYGKADLKLEDTSGDTALTAAVWSCQVDATEYLIPFSDLSHCENDEGMDALHLAVVKEDVSCVAMLLKAGADVNSHDEKGNNCLHTSAKHNAGNEILQLLLQCGQIFNLDEAGEKGRTILHWCIGDPASLDLVLPLKPDLNQFDENGASVLLLAIAHEQPLSARKLVEAGCNISMVHQDERQPIHHAAIYGDHQTVALLLEHGISPDTITPDGRTPLLLAAIEGHVKVVDVLLSRGCLVNTIYFTAVTALSVAVDQWHYLVAQSLLSNAADPNIIGPQKLSPILNAVIHGEMRGVIILIQAGADMDSETETSKHPIYMAAFKKHYGIVFLLLSVLCNMNVIKTSMKAGIFHLLVDDDEVIRAMKLVSSRPAKLKALCRKRIRTCLSYPILVNLRRLKVPRYIESFLAMEELSAFL